MELIYENSPIFLSTVASSDKRSPCKDKSRNECVQKEDDTSSKRTKVLLFVLGFTLAISLGGLWALWMNYRLADVDSLNEQLSAQELNSTALRDDLMRELEELKTNYTRIKGNFLLLAQSCNLPVNGWTACRGKLYFFSSDMLNWSSSRDDCVSRGADLVTITSQSEQNSLVSGIKQTHWIGLNDLETEGRWLWVNNQTLSETGVQFWANAKNPPEPDNWKEEDPSGENCASLGNENGGFTVWFDSSCKKQKKFICEKKYY